MTREKSENAKSSARSRDPDFAGAEAALRRAAERAWRRAADMGLPVAVYENGRIVWVDPNDKLPSKDGRAPWPPGLQ